MAQDSKTAAPSPAELRRRRLAAELRANLRRRKQQARARAAGEPDAAKKGTER